MQDFTSKFKKAKENKDWVVYDEYMTLTSKKGVMQTKVVAFLMQKYDINSQTTLWNVRRRVERRLWEQEHNRRTDSNGND